MYALYTVHFFRFQHVDDTDECNSIYPNSGCGFGNTDDVINGPFGRPGS